MDISNITIKVVENTLQDIVEILKIIDLKQTIICVPHAFCKPKILEN